MKIGRFINEKTVFAVTAAVFCYIYSDLLFGNAIFTGDSLFWYGSFYYFVDCIVHGSFPFWNPSVMSGTYFYPDISIIGLLDPAVLLSALLVKTTSLSSFTIYVYFRILRLIIFTCGSYLLISHITRSRLSAATAAGILFLAVAPVYFLQAAAVDLILYTPVALWCILRLWEAPSDPRKGLWIFILAVASGISMNIFIPVYFLFNLTVFVIGLAVLDRKRIPEVVKSLVAGSGAWIISGALVLVFMMAAPPLSVYLKDAGANGELFPVLRIVQKGGFRQIPASDLSRDSLSNLFTDDRGLFASYGFLLRLLFHQGPDSIPLLDEKNNFYSELDTYIGVISLIIAVIAGIHSRTKYKRLIIIMIATIGVNFLGSFAHDFKSYNTVQKAFNATFPLLKMMEVRQSLGSFVIFYLCVLMGMGLSLLFNRDGMENPKKLLRSIVFVSAVIFATKVIISNLMGNSLLAVTAYDYYALFQIVVFVLWAILYLGKRVEATASIAVLLCLLAADIGLYAFNRHSRETPQDIKLMNEIMVPIPFKELTGIDTRGSNLNFRLMKKPFSQYIYFAFQDNINKTNVILPPNASRIPFCTRRYYDFLTQVNIQKQFYLAGVTFPVLHFTPYDRAYAAADRKTALTMINNLPDGVSALNGPPVVIEKQTKLEPSADNNNLSRRLSDYPPAAEYVGDNVLSQNEFDKFRAKYSAELAEIDRTRALYWNNTGIEEPDVVSFDPNELAVDVTNSVSGYFVYDDGWSKYWEAYDNDRPVPLYIANYNSKAVFLEPGRHRVRFVFNPLPYRIALFLHYSGLLAAVSIIGILLLRNRKKRLLDSRS